MTRTLSRRSLLGAALAAPAVAIVAALPTLPAVEATPNPDAPITPAEYLALMEANGWRPKTDSVRGKPRGVFEYTVNEWTWEDGTFLRGIQRRAGKAGPDFYKRAAQHLFEQGRIDRVLL